MKGGRSAAGHLLAALVLLGLVGLAYHAAPDNVFQFDDEINIVRHGPMHVRELTPGRLWQAIENAHLPRRAVANLTLALDWWRGGGDPRPFQWTNLVIHGLATLAVFALLLQMLARTGAGSGRSALVAATLATAIWVVHPIQVQAVTYI
ncbi:MAG: hypothetical protein R3202_08430, partial [Candidatus Competibacterales bacterium]|nr:hypothetical protein [Candidatus Competibacterales bacterium]